MTKMRALLGALLAVAVTVPAAADATPKMKRRAEWQARYQESRQGPELTDRFSRTARLGRTGAFELSNIAGDITVTGGGGNEVRIEAVKRVRHRQESDARSLLSGIQIEVAELSNRVEVRTVYPRGRMRNVSASVDYTINMPSGASATIRTVSGDLRVTNVRGELRAETVSGTIVTSGATQLSLVKSVSGDIDVTDAAVETGATVTTVSGDLRARGLKGRSIELGSVSGDVTLTDVQAERVNIKSVSGTIEYQGTLARTGRYEMSTHSGDVRLALGGNTGFELEATTFSGTVRSDFPLTLRPGVEPPERRGRRPMNRSIRGSHGDASAIVTLSAFSGDISIVRR
jgi:DUF4097 and DUF4098 domain-containing protein YvlB